MNRTHLISIIPIAIFISLVLYLSIKPKPQSAMIEHLSIEGFVQGVELQSNASIVIVSFEDGRIKFFKNRLPDVIKQGAANKIHFRRTSFGDGTFVDEIESLTKFGEDKSQLRMN